MPLWHVWGSAISRSLQMDKVTPQELDENRPKTASCVARDLEVRRSRWLSVTQLTQNVVLNSTSSDPMECSVPLTLFIHSTVLLSFLIISTWKKTISSSTSLVGAEIGHLILCVCNEFKSVINRAFTCYICRLQLKRDGTRWRKGREVRGKLANGVGSPYPSHYLVTWCIQH